MLMVLLSCGGLGSVAWSSTGQAVPAITVDADYPGGNIIVQGIEGDTVYLRQDLRDTAGWWFYWSFRVRGAAGRAVRFEFTGKNPIGVNGPAVSLDGGRTWAWLGPEAVEGAAFTYAFAAGAGEVRFCFAIPYQESDLQAFVRRHLGDAHFRLGRLCRTRKGRGVERLHAGRVDGEPRFRVLLTARHHACESIANYVMEGILDAVLSETGLGGWFRANAEVLAVPFMDKDGVEQGDQGKNRRPHDHNRDYGGRSIYPSVAALRAFVPGWSGGKLRVALDLHCPYIRGAHNEVIYLVGSADEEIWAQQQEFAAILEGVQGGPLVYAAADNLRFGQGWNTAENYSSGVTCSRWAGALEGVRLAATIEIPYASVRGRVVTAENARLLGHDLAGALRAYLARVGEE